MLIKIKAFFLFVRLALFLSIYLCFSVSKFLFRRFIRGVVFMRTIFPIYLLMTSLIFFSCKKEVSELPPATQTGANTFGCKIDGKFWVPGGFGIIPTAPTLEAWLLPGYDIRINARNFSSSPTESEFELLIKAVTAPGPYLLNTTVSYPTTIASFGYYVHRKFTPDNEWITSPQYTGSIIITKVDTINHFVSGTFEFKAINMYNEPQPLSVTEGRFDVKLK
jgi:Family of unknown function (DUF6252)